MVTYLDKNGALQGPIFWSLIQKMISVLGFEHEKNEKMNIKIEIIKIKEKLN